MITDHQSGPVRRGCAAAVGGLPLSHRDDAKVSRPTKSPPDARRLSGGDRDINQDRPSPLVTVAFEVCTEAPSGLRIAGLAEARARLTDNFATRSGSLRW